MPAFDKFAYSDGRCYRMTQADLDKQPMRMPDPAGHAAAARDRTDRRFSDGEGRRPGADGPRQVRRVLGLGRRGLPRLPK